MDAQRATLERGLRRWPAEEARRYRARGVWRDDVVGDLPEGGAARAPSAIAAAGIDWELTYSEMADATARFGAALVELGLEQGDRVLLQVGNVCEAIIAYYGVIRAGLIPVCSIAAHGEHDMCQLAVQTRARAHVVQGDFSSQDLPVLAERVRRAAPTIEHVIVLRGTAADSSGFEATVSRMSPADARQRLSTVEVASDDIAVFQLSGGTTGTPKIVPRLHCEYLYNARRWAEVCGWDADTRVMHIVPLIHNAGISVSMQPSHLVGGRLVLPTHPHVEEIFALIEAQRVTVLGLVPPALLIRMIEHPRHAAYDLGSLRQLFVGGQRVAPEILEAAEQLFGIPCHQKFGMAEGMFFRTPENGSAWVRHNTVGAPIAPDDEVRLLEPGTENEVAHGEVGELCCRGPYTIRGYFDSEEHNAHAFTSDGYYRTGDLARAHKIDDTAYFSIEGRIKDVINRGAEKISATEVEELILRHPAVRATAVVAMPDRELGERACAFVVPKDPAYGMTLETLTTHLLAEGLAKFKWPERVELIDALPETNIKKVDKKALRALIAKRLVQESQSRRTNRLRV